VRQYAVDNGIELELGVAHEPRDNGFAERRIRTLVEGARILLASAGIPAVHWHLAIEHASYVQNHNGRLSSQYRSPLGLLLEQKPDLQALKPFGTKCWAHIADDTTPKFDVKAVEGRYVGHAPESNGLADGTLKVSPNVEFSRQPIAPPAPIPDRYHHEEPAQRMVAPKPDASQAELIASSPAQIQEQESPVEAMSTNEPIASYCPALEYARNATVEIQKIIRESGRALAAMENETLPDM